MNYASYAFYADTYHGSMDETDFNRLAPRASAYLDTITMGRIALGITNDIICTAAENACCALTDELLLQESGGEIASVNNDGYSVNYVSGVSRAVTPARRKYEIAALYLASTGLMYMGV